jgi:hypothetical protein
MDRPQTSYKGDAPYVFVSYSHKDAALVYPELGWMQEAGFNVWYDEGIEAGTAPQPPLMACVMPPGGTRFETTRASMPCSGCWIPW